MTDSAPGVHLTIPADPRFLSLVRMVVTSLAHAEGCSDEDANKVEIAVDEACTNILEHAYQGDKASPPIELEIRTAPGQLIIDILDEGVSFDFDGYVAPVFPDHWLNGGTRGVGLYLIKECMDEAGYERLPGNTNRLRLVKNLPRAS